MILVTGGAGFIGSHLVGAVLQKGWKVRILDDLSTGKVRNLEEVTGYSLPFLGDPPQGLRFFPLGKQTEFMHGDISNFEACRRACEGISYVLHHAASVSVQRSVEDPIRSHNSNATGTLNILQAARETGVKRVVYASSSSVYGNIMAGEEELKPRSESFPPFPQSPYAATKLLGENYCRIFSDLFGLETVSLRYFNVFGPRQDPNSVYAAVIPKFIHALLHGYPPVIYGDGQQTRDFTYVKNIVQANLLAMERPGVSGQVFNVACGQRISINDLLSHLQGFAARRIPARFEPPRSGEVRHSLSSILRAQEHLGYEVQVELPEGLAATWNWFREKEG